MLVNVSKYTVIIDTKWLKIHKKLRTRLIGKSTSILSIGKMCSVEISEKNNFNKNVRNEQFLIKSDKN